MSEERQDEEVDGWIVRCLEARPDAEGGIWSLVLLTDQENFYSQVFHHADMGRKGDLVYDVEGWLTSFWLADDSALFVVDRDGCLHSNETGRWTKTDLGCPKGLNTLTGLPDSGLATAGEEGAVLRRVGGAWERVALGQGASLYGAHGVAQAALYVAGDKGYAACRGAARWRDLHLPTSATLTSVLARSPEEIYIAGENGALFVGGGDRWRMLDNDEHDVYGLAWYQGRLVLAAGVEGVLQWDGTSVDSLKEGVDANFVAAAGRFLCVAARTQVWRFDGRSWRHRTFSL